MCIRYVCGVWMCAHTLRAPGRVVKQVAGTHITRIVEGSAPHTTSLRQTGRAWRRHASHGCMLAVWTPRATLHCPGGNFGRHTITPAFTHPAQDMRPSPRRRCEAGLLTPWHHRHEAAERSHCLTPRAEPVASPAGRLCWSDCYRSRSRDRARARARSHTDGGNSADGDGADQGGGHTAAETVGRALDDAVGDDLAQRGAAAADAAGARLGGGELRTRLLVDGEARQPEILVERTCGRGLAACAAQLCGGWATAARGGGKGR